MNIGIAFALITALLYGSWAVPAKTLKVDAKVMAFWLTVGHLLIAFIVFLFSPSLLSINNSTGPFFGGLMWAIGIILAFVGIKNLGIARAFGIWIPTLLLVSSVWGLIFFGEAQGMSIEKLLKVILSITLLIAAALLIISTSKGEKKLGNIKVGILSSIAIGLLHGSFFVPMNFTNLSASQALLPASIGMILVTATVSFFKKLKLNIGTIPNLRMATGGVILGVGNMTALMTIKLLGVSTGFPLTQLAIVVNTLWGVFVFKEVTSKSGKLIISLGIAMALAGAILLNSARVS